MSERINEMTRLADQDAADDVLLDSVAIIGMSGRFPGAPDVDAFWQNIAAGKVTISHFAPTELEARNTAGLEHGPDYVAARGVLENPGMFDAEFFGISPRDAESMDPQHRIFLETCWNALEDAGYDQSTYPGQIGLFGGCSLNTYLLANLCKDRAFIDEVTGNYQVGEFRSFMGNDKDFLTTRVAYKLNLRGPCISVASACATSLVAVAQASQSLLNYQCDMALAGGVSVTFPQRRGHLYSEGSIGSKDGFCRPFDAAATGTVFGHGAGAVLLKRLEDAIADRDHITAVIRGFGVNNDGSMKAGYMAPGVDGQSGVIAAAQAMAGVSARSITYLEAHGTATPLGDPIEVAALTKAFRLSTEASGFCAIGTAKANVGHLDAAAGVAGVIKTAMSLSKGILPPLAKFETPNPNIDFENSPFYVNREESPWRSDGPRRAGVSAFGVGGVNAHVVLEETPTPSAFVASARSTQLLCVSARSPSALQKAKENLAGFLKTHPEVPLEDVAYTLAVGRKAFDYRAAFVCAGADDAVAKLVSAGSQANKISAKRPEIVFLFPGQGSQFAGMGSSLYKSEPLYRREVDECSEILRPMLELDLREILFPVDVASPEAAERILQTQFAQTGIFVTEFAMAKLWQAWGFEPRATAGHSIGEYVAAVLAGVMSREDALRLVSIRGRMMQEMPRGGMVGVRLGESELQPYLAEDISIAALNAPKLSVLAGPVEAMERLEKKLTSEGALFRRLRTSHAFHSSMMDPMLSGFEAEVAKISLHAPARRYVSSFTGTWIEAEQATSPRFWADQVRNPVRFADALKTLMATPQILLEVGPGSTLATLARQQPNSSAAVIVSSLSQRDEQSPVEVGSLQEALGQLWVAGAAPDWSKVYAQEQRSRISLPTYPFERKLYWIEPPPFVAGSTINDQAASATPQRLHEQREVEASSVATEPLREAPMQERKLRLQPIVAEVFTQLSGIDITPDQMDHQFLELGLDSLFLTQATQGLQKKFGVKLTFRQIMEQFSTISSLAEYLDSVLPADAFAAAVQVQAAPVQEVAPPGGVLVAASIVSSSLPAVGGSAVERLFSEQMAMMSKVFEQQMATLRGAAVSAPMIAVPSATVPAPVAVSAAVQAAAAPAPASEAPEVKHGSYRPLQPRVQQELDSDQQGYLDALIAKYEKRTPGSKRLTDKARVHLADPRAVAGFRPQWKEMVYPLVTERAKGARIWDVDGNEYIDIVNGYGAIMFGHSPQFVVDAVYKQIEMGVAIGPQSPLAGEVAAQICEMTGNERVTFCNTGSEAVMAAIRVARTVTGRDRIVYFAGDYHGTFDEVLVRNTPRGTVPLAPGIPLANTRNVVVLEYGADASLDYIRKNASEIAAVLIEPVQTRNPGLQPIAFIKTIRQITEQAEIALIIDEVVTGFRLSPGGVQETFGVRGDLATYGKVIGGGYPIGVLSGSARFMDALDGGAWQYGDASIPEVGVTFFAGTFVRHPQALAAARSVLHHLKSAGPQLQMDLNRKTAEMATRLDDFFVERGVPSRVHHFASWFYFTFHGDARLGSLLYYAMREKGVHIQEGYPCFLTTAHSETDLETVEGVFRETVEEMQKSNALPSHGVHPVEVSAPPSAVAVMHPAALAQSPAHVPITEAQREIYFAAALSDEANCAFNESVTLRLGGKVDEKKLQRALESVFARHDALRSRISEDGESILISPVFTGHVEYVDLCSSPGAAELREQALQEAIEAEGTTPFSLTDGPLVRATIFRMSADEVVLLFTGHHMVLDGWSVNQLFEEISKFYNAKDGGADAKLLPLLPFSSYAVQEQTRERSGEFADNEAYWVNRFSGLAPVLDLPTDRPRPMNKTYRGATLKGSLGSALYMDLKSASSRLVCTLYVTLLSGFQLLLHRLTRQSEVVVGISTAGQALFENASLVGHCVHFLPMLSQITDAETVKSHLAATRNVLFDAFDHQEFTYGSLLHKLSIPRDSSRLPLIEVQFNLEKIGARISFDGLSSVIKANPKRFVNTDMFLNVIETENDLEFDCDFNTDLFDEETVRRWMHLYANLLSNVSRDPAVRVDELALLNREDRLRVVEDWNRTEVEFDREFVPIHRWAGKRAYEQVSQTVGSGATTWTTSELDRYANRVARRLKREGLKTGDLVGLCVERSVEMLGALLGVLKAGGAYVPLDPRHPKDRLEMVLDDSGAAILVVGGSFASAQPGFRTTAKMVVLDEKIAAEDAAALDVPVGPDDLAYVIYTSGTTGRPKGVAIEHRALMNLLRSMEREPGLVREDVFVAVTTLAFDIAGLELLLPLLTGARLVIATEEQVVDGYLLLQLLERTKATVLQATPGTWRMLIDAGWGRQLPLKVLCGGEALPRDLADQLLERSEEVWNVYGPTETTIWSSATRVTAGTGPLMVGPPIANTQFYVLDQRLEPAPIGVVGELYIGGQGLARGYWKRPELTGERFLNNPFAAGRMYKTGDLGRWHVDASGQGRVELLGRTDFQVKIRGYRIELGEIEAALNRHPAVREAVVAAHTSKSAGAAITRLVAYVDAGNSAEHAGALTADLLTMLGDTLPEYMIPAIIVPLPQLPRSPNGKIDRKALPDADAFLKSGLHSAQRTFMAPTTSDQKKLAAIWAEVLMLDRVSITDSIFELGADSLLIFRIAARSQKEGLHVTAAQIFKHRTILALSNGLGEQTETKASTIKVAPRIAVAPRKAYRGESGIRG